MDKVRNFMASKRPNQIVTDGETMGDQPAQKNARIEEEQPSNALSEEESSDELEKSLVKLLAQLVDSRRKTEEAGLESARQINSLIQKVRDRRSEEDGIVSDMTREYAALKEKLEAAKRDEDIAKNMHFDQAAKIWRLEGELDQSRKREEAANEMRDGLSRENSALKEELEKMRATAEEDRSNGAMREMMGRMNGARIVDLSRKLAQSENALKALKQSFKGYTSLQEGLMLVMNSEATDDIFQFCFPSIFTDSISVDEARRLLEVKLNECTKEVYRRYCNRNGQAAIIIKCPFCQKTVRNKIVDHFVSEGHYSKVRAIGTTVSLPAVQHWLQHLQQAIDWKEGEREEKEREIEKPLEERSE